MKMTGIEADTSREEKVTNHRDYLGVPIWSCAYRRPSEWVSLVEY